MEGPFVEVFSEAMLGQSCKRMNGERRRAGSFVVQAYLEDSWKLGSTSARSVVICFASHHMALRLPKAVVRQIEVTGSQLQSPVVYPHVSRAQATESHLLEFCHSAKICGAVLSNRICKATGQASKFHTLHAHPTPCPIAGKVHKPSNPPSRSLPSPLSLVLLSRPGSGSVSAPLSLRSCSFLSLAAPLISHGHGAVSFSSADCRSVSASQIIAQYLPWFVVFWSKISIQLTLDACFSCCLIFLVGAEGSTSASSRLAAFPSPLHNGIARQRHIFG
jgi:hypothetical protein